MKKIHRFDLPFPPSVNSYYGNNKFGSKYISKKGKEYRSKVISLIGDYNTISNRVSVLVELHAPDLRRRDLDNYLKSLLDSLTHSRVYEDDEQIDFLSVIRCPKIKGGLCVVYIIEEVSFFQKMWSRILSIFNKSL